MIKAENLSLVYKNGTVGLDQVSLNIPRGELVFITGPSGSGKTSLLKLLMGMEYATDGNLTVMDVEMKAQNSKKIKGMRTTIGPVFQEFKLLEGRTALENVVIGMRFIPIPGRQIEEMARNAITKVGLAHKMDSLVEHLSFGEAQRIAIARAVARKPLIIIADEPTGNLDNTNAQMIINLLASFRNEETTVIMTTHATHLIEGRRDATFLRFNQGQVRTERI